MKRDCEKFAKLRANPQFMAVIEDYDDDEMEHLDLLICSTNTQVCKYCLAKTCNGSCGDVPDALASTMRKFFADGAYEQVLVAKMDRQTNEFGHSSFSRDSYLSTRPTRVPEGADHEDDQEDQENISISSRPTPEQPILQAEGAQEDDLGSVSSEYDEDTPLN